MSAQHWNSGYLARDMGPTYCGGCRADWPCDGSLIEASERKTQQRIAAALEGPAVLLRDTPEDRERLLAAETAYYMSGGPLNCPEHIDAIIAALRGSEK